MSKPVSTFTHSMFQITAHWVGMDVSSVADLPCWMVQVLDPDIGMERTLYIRLNKNPEYTGNRDPRTVMDERRQMVKGLFAWYCKLGVDPEKAQFAAERFPVWHIDPKTIPPLGSIQGDNQMVPYKMQFGPLFKLITYRSMKSRVVNVRSNVLGKVTVGDTVFPWFLVSNDDVRKSMPLEAVGWLNVTDREAFGKSLNEQFLLRWPFFAREGMEDLLPQFEVLGKEDYNTLFPRSQLIVDLDGWK